MTVLFWLFAFACAVPAEQTAFEEGLAHLRGGDSAGAVTSFSDALDQGVRDPAVYHGLGNALHRLDKPGPAIAAWRRGLALAPRNGDIAANLDLAGKSLRDRVEPPRGHRGAFFWQSTLAPLETAMAASGAMALAMWMLVVGRLRPSIRVSKGAVATIASVGVLLAVSTADALQQRRAAVVVVPEVDVRSALGPSGVSLFVLHEGATVAISDRTDTHSLISLTDGRKGWVNHRALISTNPADPFELPDG